MKNLKNIPILIVAGISLFFASCEVNEVTEVREVVEADPNILFERRNVNLIARNNNEFQTIINFPNGFEVRDSDLVIAYRSIGIDNQSRTDVWDALPKTYSENIGLISYNFNYSINGIEIIMVVEDNVDLNSLSDFTTNQIFQFAILPSRFDQSSKILNRVNLIMKKFPKKLFF